MIYEVNPQERAKFAAYVEKLREDRDRLLTKDWEILDYLDFFEYTCLQSAINILPEEHKKIHDEKLDSLLENLEKIKKPIEESPAHGRIFQGINKALKNFEKFVEFTFDTPAHSDYVALESLYQSEYYAIVARTNFMELYAKEDEK